MERAWVGPYVGWGRVSGDIQGRSVLARLMESQIWHQLTSSLVLLGEGLEKGQWPLLPLIADTSVSPCIPLVTFKLPAILVLDFRGSESV